MVFDAKDNLVKIKPVTIWRNVKFFLGPKYNESCAKFKSAIQES